MSSDQNTQNQAGNRPYEKHRDGALECAIWRRETDKGPLYNTELTRSYQDKDGNWKNTHVIPERDLLKAARLQEQAYTSIQLFRDQDRAQYVLQQQEQRAQGVNREHPREH